MQPLILTPEELRALTMATQAKRQLERLHEAGFTRARIVAGRVVLEREHYSAVVAGRPVVDRPRVRLMKEEQKPRVRMAAA